MLGTEKRKISTIPPSAYSPLVDSNSMLHAREFFRSLFRHTTYTLALLALAIASLGGCIQHPTAPVSDLSPLPELVQPRTHYTVKKGDTLYSIAFRTNQDYKEIALWNGIQPPYTIYVSDRLRLTPPANARNQPATPQRPVNTTQNTTRQPARPSTPASSLTNVPLPKDVALWAWPTNGKLIAKYSPKKGVNGIQVSGRTAAPVNAAAAGQVVYAGTGIRGYGQLIIIKHSDNFLSAYAHNQKMLVKEGQSVVLGQQVAEMGSTGTTRTKLHFEIRKNGKPVNPLKYLPLQRA